jgi:hypothetical protein
VSLLTARYERTGERMDPAGPYWTRRAMETLRMLRDPYNPNFEPPAATFEDVTVIQREINRLQSELIASQKSHAKERAASHREHGWDFPVYVPVAHSRKERSLSGTNDEVRKIRKSPV